MGYNKGHKVPPRSIKMIREYAHRFKDSLGIKVPYFPIEAVYDFLHKIVPGAHFEVRTQEELGGELGGELGLTFPDKKAILLREDVYIGAVAGDNWHRFTMAHELAHLLIHPGVIINKLARGTHKSYEDSEWQADCFAGELLVDHRYCDSDDVYISIATRHGVTIKSAKVQLDRFKKEGLLPK